MRLMNLPRETWFPVEEQPSLRWAYTSSKWTMIKARLFGKKLEGTDGRTRFVGYSYDGVVYLASARKVTDGVR